MPREREIHLTNIKNSVKTQSISSEKALIFRKARYQLTTITHYTYQDSIQKTYFIDQESIHEFIEIYLAIGEFVVDIARITDDS